MTIRERIRGVHHVAVSVPDIDIARKFYIDLLGAEEISNVAWDAGNPFIDEIVGLKDCAGKQFIARLGNTQIEVFEYLSPRSDAQDPNRPVNLYGYTHFGLEVDDIQSVYNRMVEAGIRFHTAPDMNQITTDENGNKSGFTATYGRDFFGNVFEILEIHENDYIKSN